MIPGLGQISSLGQFGQSVLNVILGVNGLTTISEMLNLNDVSVMFDENEDSSDFDEAVKDGEPCDKHKVFDDSTTKLPKNGEPNSSADLLNEDGSVKQRRYYGPDGLPCEDIDYNHSDNGTHKFPDRHKWDWSKTPPRLKGEW